METREDYINPGFCGFIVSILSIANRSGSPIVTRRASFVAFVQIRLLCRLSERAVMREPSGQIDSSRSSQSGRLKSRAYRPSRPQGKSRDDLRLNCRALCEGQGQCEHRVPESRIARSASPVVSCSRIAARPPIAETRRHTNRGDPRAPRSCLDASPRTTAHRQWWQWLPEVVRTASHRAVEQQRVASIRGQTRRIASGRRQSDAECRTRSQH
jgi:hypothetical protein